MHISDNGKGQNRLQRRLAETAAAAPRQDAPADSAAGALLLFEVSWEVCSQSGGIYTVLRSKAPAAVQRWGEGYWLVGPYREAAAKIEFEPRPATGPVAEAIETLRQRGVGLHTGRWLVSGRPKVILVDLQSVMRHVGEMKYFLWKDIGISTPDGDHEYESIIALGYVVADLLALVRERLSDQQPMLAQFHEWQGAAAVPILRHRSVRVPTVFTTHATLIGRSLSAANVDLYERLHAIKPDAVAAEHGISHRFQIERTAAQRCDVFTTVSDITAQEAEVFLGRRPDALLPNGLNIERFAAPHEFQNLHQKCKEHIHEFVMGHFFPSYTFELQRTLYIFIAGRYEYRNKGMDVFIEALHELNRRLLAEPSGVTVVAFIVTRAPYRGLNVETLNRQAMFHELRDACQRIKEDMGRRLFSSVVDGELPVGGELIDETARVRLTRMIHAWKQPQLPTIVTHDLIDDAGDPVLNHLRRRRLLNAPHDPVKVVYHPEFITSTSPVIGLEYDDFVRGCNLGVFPSYYEPWGYTPMECVVRGVPAITSDLSGFGAYLMDHFPDHDANGMYVARRRRVSLNTTVYQVAGWLHALTRMSLRERIALRNRVESYADAFDWTHMSRYYRAARRMALERYYPGLQPIPTDEELEPAQTPLVRPAYVRVKPRGRAAAPRGEGRDAPR